jgi:hypothetical protein
MGTTTTPTPGIYHNVPADEYFAWRAVNNSSLTYLARSPMHYRYQPPMDATAAMWFGTLGHCGVLEPEALKERYDIIPDLINEKTGKPYGVQTQKYLNHVMEFKEKSGREVATKSDFTDMLRIVTAVHGNEFARQYLCPRGKSEVCVVWEDPDSRVLCKARCDKWDGVATICDLKTTKDASDFERSIAKFAYHRQAAFYSDGMTVATGTPHRFGIVAVEKTEPFGCRGGFMSQAAVAQGRREYKRLLLQLAECRLKNEWPGYTDPDEWTLPAWAIETEEPALSLNGEMVIL